MVITSGQSSSTFNKASCPFFGRPYNLHQGISVYYVFDHFTHKAESSTTNTEMNSNSPPLLAPCYCSKDSAPGLSP
jgi:hypothetical protein